MELVQAYLHESSYWDAYNAEGEAKRELDAELTRGLDATAAEPFDNKGRA